ncbi:MAG TPA: DUF1015 domain-containing protein [Thermoanaerobaculia bacterium]|nr:DUF1015 domain-containing protein [Thermoanaerobaculia bacterium]
MEIHPFRALRYSPGTIEERGLDNLVAPPYDRVTPKIREELYARAPENIVHFDARKEEGGDVYAEANWQLKEWLRTGAMYHERSAAVWIHQVVFPGRDGTTKARRSLVALVRLEPYDGGSIRPHERTLAKAKEDRLNLLMASHADFGMVFLLSRAPLDPALQTRRAPDLSCHDLAGNRHDVWRIEDTSEHVRFERLLSTAGSLIADGHHRYETALKFSKMPEAEKLPTAAFKLCAIVDVASPGLEAFAIPRAVSGLPDFSADAMFRKAETFFETASFTSPEEGRAALEALPRDRSGFLVVTKDATRLVTLRPDAPVAWPAEKSAAWRKLDVSTLEIAFLRGVLGIEPAQIERGEHVSFPKDEDAAVELARSGGAQMAILLRPTPIDAVQDVVAQGEVLPQKSTLFEPKMISGLFGVSLEDPIT